MKKYILSKWAAAFVGVAVLVGTIACNNGGGSSSSVSSAYGISGGVLSNPVLVYNTIASSSYYGDYVMSMSMYSQSGYNTYSGNPVAFTGQLVITDGLYCAPVGTYTVTTTQSGTMSGTSVGPMTLVASGPANIQMNVSYGIIENAGSRMSFNMNLYVNGQYCGQLITD